MVEGARRATATIPPPEAVTTTTEDMTNDHPSDTSETGSNKKRRFLSAEKKFQIYLEALSPVTSKGTTQGRNSGVKITHPSQHWD
jgi:hypothetical protein